MLNKEEYYNTEDMRNLYKVEWVNNFQFRRFDNKMTNERIEYYNSIFEKLMETLPTAKANNLLLMARKSNTRESFEYCIRSSVSDMQLSLSKMKNKNIPNFNKLNNKKCTFKSYKEKFDKIFSRPTKTEAEMLTVEQMLDIAPIEIMEYAGFKLTKYDKQGSYFVAIIQYPKELCKRAKLIYNASASQLEMTAESEFNELIDNYVKQNSNPYGDKEGEDISIDNIEQVMNSSNVNPLDEEIF